MWVLLAALVVWGALIYNDFLHRQAMIEAAWADLQRRLRLMNGSGHEQAILDATEYHNTLVRDYNTKLRFLPHRFIAKAAKFQPKTPYQHGR